MAEENVIGRGRCPCCGNIKARFSVSKKQLAVVTCNACNFQGFARSDASDEALRKLIASEPAARANPPEIPASAIPAPAKQAEPAPAVAGGFRWGFLGATA